MAIQRPHYFDHQLLIEQDFTLEQNYHLDMRRRLNRGLYSFGIVEGLRVTKTANRSVTVQAGAAIDSQGREIILDAPRPVTISGAAGTRVFITAAYQETQTDQSTTTGATGFTRWTEDPVIVFVTAIPPGDGSVIPLAVFDLDAGANVPGNLGDFVEGTVRQSVTAKGGGLRSVNNITSPGGNLSVLPVPGQSIIITNDDTNDRITIGENHSLRTDNPHATTAAQVGAMAAADYDLRRRAAAQITFNNLNSDGATSTVNVGFVPRVVIVSGTCTANLSGRAYSGGIGAFAFLDPPASSNYTQRCFGFGITRISNTDWLFRSLSGTNILSANIQDQGAGPPIQAETLSVLFSGTTATGLTAVLNRTVLGGAAALANFTILLHLLCMG
jgi:hypothetical protein